MYTVRVRIIGVGVGTLFEIGTCMEGIVLI